MPPVLTTSSGIMGSETKTLEHCTLLLKRVIVALTAAEAIAKVVVVFVVAIGHLRVYTTFSIGNRVDAQTAGVRRWQSSRATIAGKVSLVEDLDEGMFTMALDGA